MSQTINYESSIKVDENQLIDLKIEIKRLPEKLVKEYFLTSESELHKYISKVLIDCLKNIGASETINNEGFDNY